MKKGNLETIHINKITTTNFNPNEMSDKMFDHLKTTIQERGYMQPLTVAEMPDGDYMVIDGHHRFKAMVELGETEIPCYVMNDKTPRDIKIDLINMNRTRGEFNQDKYNELLKSLHEDMAKEELKNLLNLEEEMVIFEEDNPLSEDDFEPPKEAKYKIELGDIYQLGTHRLMCGDSTDSETVHLLMDGNKADMVFTDPPYGVDYSSKNVFLNRVTFGKRIEKDILGDTENIETTVKLWKDVFLNKKNILKEGGNFYITFSGDKLLLLLLLLLREIKFQERQILVWAKNNHVLGRSDYNYKHEFILYGWKTGKGHKFYAKHDVTLWEFDKPLKNDLHPTMKPIPLIEKAINNSSKQGEIIIDFFGGSGSTLIACEQTGRRCHMMEIDPYYCSVIIERFIKLKGRDNEIWKIVNGEKTPIKQLKMKDSENLLNIKNGD